MNNNKVSNLLKIEFEGTDGAGKSVSMAYFAEEARKRGLSVVETREVGNPHIPVCVKMREFVLDPNSGLSGEAMEMIFGAMRFENDRWLKNLQKSNSQPDLVISDRGWLSHLAYTDHNVSRDFTNILYNDALFCLTEMPDYIIYFDVDTETALKRRVKRGTGMDVIEMKGVEFQDKVRASFEEYMAYYEDFFIFGKDDTESEGMIKKIFRVDANQDLKGVQKQLDLILDEMQELVGKA